MPDETSDALLILTADIVVAHASKNRVDASDLPDLIRTVHDSLGKIAHSVEAAPAAPEFTPAVGVRKSLANPDKIISLIDGKPYSTLKRHLTGHGLTPESYRDRYRLPPDYPMIAPAYSKKRKAIAVEIGLGQKVAGVVASAVEAVENVVETIIEQVAPARRGKPKKVVQETEPTRAHRKKLSISQAKAVAQEDLTPFARGSSSPEG